MQRRTHAAIGASTLTTSWSISTPVPADAARSIELVGSTSASVRLPADPVTAARRWLAQPQRARELDPTLRLRAEQAVDVAEAHLRALDELAGELAKDVDVDGVTDPSRFAHVDEMAGELLQFSDRLRALLDPEHRVPDAADRLARGLEAVAKGGGLRALVAAI